MYVSEHILVEIKHTHLINSAWYFQRPLLSKPDEKLQCDGSHNRSGKEDITNPPSCIASCQSLIWKRDFGAAATDDVHYLPGGGVRMFL